MAELDLSPAVPPSASWVKLHYELTPRKEGADLIARLCPTPGMKEPVVIRGAAGDVFLRLTVPQKLYYQHPVTVQLKLKVTAYKQAGDPEEPPLS